MKARNGMAYLAVLMAVLLLTTLGLTLLSRVSVQRVVTDSRVPAMQAAYLAESAASHAMWRLLNDTNFPASTNTYTMHSLAGGRYGYKVRKHTGTTFATVSVIGVFSNQVVRQSYVLYVVPTGRAGMAVWSGGSTPEYNVWDGSVFGATKSCVYQGSRWRIMAGASAPTRDEMIVAGVENGGQISGEMWNGTAWSSSNLAALATVSVTDRWSVDAAYASLSGDLMLVWNSGLAAGATLQYKVWNGTAWSAASSVSGTVLPVGCGPQQLRLAASPTSDEMVLVVSDVNSYDYALVWNGSQWGNGIALHTGFGDDQTDVYAAYEQQGGRAMVVYSRNGVDVTYRLWNGTAWSSESTVARAAGIVGKVRWATLASDPGSDRIALGVLTFSKERWFAVWDGSAWGEKISSSMASPGDTYPNVAVAFEGRSGQALATYGRSAKEVMYRTWTPGVGWSAEVKGPNVGANPNSMMLDAIAGSDTIMLSVQDAGSDLNYVHWDGGAWGGARELETSSGEIKNQPFLFLYRKQ